MTSLMSQQGLPLGFRVPITRPSSLFEIVTPEDE